MRHSAIRTGDWPAQVFGNAALLSDAEFAAVEARLGPPERRRGGDWLQEEGASPWRAQVIVSGWAAQARLLLDGRRQIGRVLVPGDVTGLSRPAGEPFMGVIALTDVIVADATGVRELVEAGCGGAIGRNWASLQRAEHAGALAHIVRLGRFTAYERTGHLLLELYERLAAARLTQGLSMPMPLTQEMLADCLGLSVVHLNRMMQQLRRNGLISAESRRVRFLDLPRMARECLYAPRAETVRRAQTPMRSF